MRSTGLSAAEKSAVTAACQALIDNFLKPRFLPTIRRTQFNYPVDILGKWHGTKYRFVQRYRSGFPENLGRVRRPLRPPRLDQPQPRYSPDGYGSFAMTFLDQISERSERFVADECASAFSTRL